jgi:hypothetical protein
VTNAAVILFEDSFEGPTYTANTAFPGGTGTIRWTDNSGSTSTGFLDVTDARASDGTQSVFMRDGGRSITSRPSASALRIDVTGYSTLIIEYHVAQNMSADYEGLGATNGIDNFTFSMGIDGSALAPIIRSYGAINFTGTEGGTEANPLVYNGTPIDFSGPGTGSATLMRPTDNNFDTYYVQVNVGNASWVQLAFTATAGSTNENYWLDDISITGLVPEPTSAAFLVIGTGFFLRRRRRQAAIG